MHNCEGTLVVAAILLVLPCWRYAREGDGGKRNVGTGGSRS